MYTFPAASTASPVGWPSVAELAAPPSPESPGCWGIPATA